LLESPKTLTSLQPLPPHVAAVTPFVTTQTVAIVGLGYVGLPTALAFADNDAPTRVLGVDISAERLESIRSGHVDLIPADVARLDRVLAADVLELTNDDEVLARADAVIICVPTPVDRHLTPDLRALRNACASAVHHARPGQTIILTSTSYIGTTEELLVEPLRQRGLRIGDDVYVAFSPERIDPGNTTMTQEKVPRVVGGVTLDCTQRAASFIEQIAPVVHVVTSPGTAEFAKLFENTYRAVNIALVNEMADVARTFDLDIMEVIAAAATKPYGFSAFYPGPGIGGHCIPCDPHYLLWHLRAERGTAPLVETAMSRSAARPGQVVTRALEVLASQGKAMQGARVLLVGVTYKPDVQDVRESPALEILSELRERRAHVAFQDALIAELTLEDGTRLQSEPIASAEGWDLVILHTSHTDTDLSWLSGARAVLDTTYRLNAAANRFAL
jgi:UDP-N-acetyl-D-glucosamine dehydrogenase